LAEALRPRIYRLADIARELGWHLDFLAPGWLVTDLMPVLRKLPVDFTLAHMGLFPAEGGAAQPGFQGLLELLRHGEGRCWVKLTGVYRMSTAPGFADAAALAQALIDTAPDRLIWGSDYPHLSFHDRVGSIQLFNLLGQWAPDEADRARILVENPQKLFGFG
jgi:predicted TIM-barrel fold metal-dependent hydrolase